MDANVCAIVGAMAGGLLSDRIGRRGALAVGSIATLVILFICFPMLETRSFPVMLAAMGAFLGFTQFQSGIQPVAFAEAFPTNVRYSGSALAYTGANLTAGAPMPVLAAWLVGAANGSPWGVVALRRIEHSLANHDPHRAGDVRHRHEPNWQPRPFEGTR
jgi:MFS family permease